MELFHEKLDVYRLYLEAASLSGNISSRGNIPIVALDHLDRAMESIGVNLMRANVQAPGSLQRISHLNVSIASTNECAAALDVCFAKEVMGREVYESGLNKLWRIRGMLLGLKRVGGNQVREEQASYGSPEFPHAALDMYQVSLDGVRWIHDLLKEVATRARTKRKLDISTTGTVLNIAEGHGRVTPDDQNRFMKTAQEHAFQTVVLLDLMVTRNETAEFRIADGKVIQARVISMLLAWCAKNAG